MGFGILFVGYLFAFGFTSGANYIVSIVGIIGTVFLFFASRKLSLYSKHFKTARIASIMLGAAYLLNTAGQICQSFGVINEQSLIPRLLRAAVIATVFLFNTFMYLGISEIATSVQDIKLSLTAYRNLIVMIIYYLFIALSSAVAVISPENIGIFSLISAILGLFWLVLSVLLVMSAYMRICLPGDEDMPINTKNN